MSNKLLLYILISPLVIYAMSSLNINGIFKKNHIVQARIFFVILICIVIYLFVNFIYDIYMCY